MSYPFLAHAQVLEPGTLQELDTLVTRLRTFLQVAHRDDGSLYPPAASVPGVLAILTADPSSPADNTAWILRSGTSPAMAISLRLRIAGVTSEIPLGSL